MTLESGHLNMEGGCLIGGRLIEVWLYKVLVSFYNLSAWHIHVHMYGLCTIVGNIHLVSLWSHPVGERLPWRLMMTTLWYSTTGFPRLAALPSWALSMTCAIQTNSMPCTWMSVGTRTQFQSLTECDLLTTSQDGNRKCLLFIMVILLMLSSKNLVLSKGLCI